MATGWREFGHRYGGGLANLEDAKSYFEHRAHQEALAQAAAATKYEWTARLTHTMSSG